MTLAKVKEQDGMMLAKVEEQDGMMLAKVKEQDGTMLAKVKVPQFTVFGRHSPIKKLTVVKGIGRGFRILSVACRLSKPLM